MSRAHTPIATSRPAWVAGAPATGRPRRSAGSRSSSSPSALGGMSARRTSTRTRPGRASPAAWTGSSTPGFKQPAGRERPDPEPLATRRRRRLQGGDRGRRRTALEDARTSSNVRSPLEPGNADQIATDGHAALVEFEIRGDKDKAVDKIGPVLDARRRPRRGPTRASSIGEFGDASAVEGGRDRLRRRPRQGRAALAADHAGHPRAGVRRAGRGGDPAAARVDRRLRDVRPDRAAEPRAAGRDAGAGDRAPDRARRRRRLLDVLLEARARRARRRAQRAGCARGRRRDLRPLGADLRPDRDGGDGRHVPDRRPDVRLARRRDDPRRRRRGARLADRASRAALAARRQRRPGTRAVRRPARPRRRRRAGSGARSSTASCGGPSLSAIVAGGLLLALALPALQLRLAAAGARSFPQVARGDQDIRPDAAGVPGHRAAGERRRQGAERADAGDAAGDRAAQAAGARERPRVRADHRRRQPAGTVANITIPIAGNGTDAASNASFRMLRETSSPRRSARFRTRRPASPG